MRSTNVVSAEIVLPDNKLLCYEMLQRRDEEGRSGLRGGVEVDLGGGNALGVDGALPGRPRASLCRRPSNDLNGEM